MDGTFQQLVFSDDLKRILDELPFYVLLIDDTHCIHYANQAVNYHLQVDLEDIIGKHCPKIIHNCDGPFWGCPLEEAVSKGEGVEREIFEPTLNIWLTSAIYPTQLRSPEGKTIYFHIVYDITARKNAEEQLKETQKEILSLNKDLDKKVQDRTSDIQTLLQQKDNFLHLLAHDLKNPLNIPLCLLPILQHKCQDEEQKEMIDTCLKSMRNMKRLITETLELVLLEDPTKQVHYESIGLKDLINDVIETNKDCLVRHNVMVENGIHDDVVIAANRFQLEQVISNLFSNAVKYTPEDRKGIIQIQAQSDGHMMQISITDNGIGLSQDQIDHVFDKFYKVTSERKDMQSTGLGLSICKTIVEKHHGNIWVESQGPGQGCIFRFTLPLNPPHSP